MRRFPPSAAAALALLAFAPPASAQAPEIRDWLLRRTALQTRDSAERVAIYNSIRLPPVLARLVETEIQARLNWGDSAGAAVLLDSVGRVTEAARVRLALARTPAARRAVARRLAEYVIQHPAGAETRPALELLAATGPPLSGEESLQLARAASRIRLAARAVALYPRAIAAGRAEPADRLAYGRALAALGRHREAITVLSRVTAPAPVAAEAALERARSEYRLGRRTQAVRALEHLANHAASADVMTRSLFLAGDIQWRAGDGERARRDWLELVRRAPASDSAGRAGFLAALILWERGDAGQAAAEWQRIHEGTAGPVGVAAGYWAGRAWDEVGQRPRAEAMWMSVMARDSLSWYSLASARRLGVEPWRPAPAADRFQHFADLDSAVARIGTLRLMGLTQEADWERDWLLDHPRGGTEWLLAAADYMRRSDEPAAALALARRAARAGAPADSRTYRLMFPLLHGDELRRHAADQGLDPSIVAALIRQESAWESRATSRVGALGLMQVMPATGREIARALGLTRWTRDLLYDPETNLRVGIHHLSRALHRFAGDLTQALAAYNAGASRTRAWAQGRAARDPELFMERISIPETRNYVQIVQWNVALYRSLYPEQP
jgi:soluble lytic murein transglycosylase